MNLKKQTPIQTLPNLCNNIHDKFEPIVQQDIEPVEENPFELNYDSESANDTRTIRPTDEHVERHALDLEDNPTSSDSIEDEIVPNTVLIPSINSDSDNTHISSTSEAKTMQQCNDIKLYVTFEFRESLKTPIII